MKIKSAVWQGARTVRKKLCQLVLFVQSGSRGAGKKGFCGMDERIYLARAALHMWEEPCISGTKGSGAVFFSGCGLRCCFCRIMILLWGAGDGL